MAQQTINVGTTPNDGTGDAPRVVGQKINAMTTELYGAITSPVPQVEVTASNSLTLNQTTHQGATITLSGSGSTFSANATNLGNGFVCTIKNRTGADFLVPPFSGATREYARGAAHTKIASNSDASVEIYTRNAAMYVSVIGDTL